MSSTAVIVEHYEQRYGFEENRFFGLFTSFEAWELYCNDNNIKIIEPCEIITRKRYQSDEFVYNAHEVSFIQ